MRPSSNLFSSSCTSVCVVLSMLVVQASGYFIIDEPGLNRQWVNNAANLVSWSKGVLDGINGFDVELARMSVDGLKLVARNVPAKPANFNIMLLDVPAGDDYFLVFLNSTHGVMHVTSSRFSIVAAGTTPTSPPAQLAASAPTVTISGSPNPTQHFATTFPAIASAAWRNLGLMGLELQVALLMSVLSCIFGAMWTVGW